MGNIMQLGGKSIYASEYYYDVKDPCYWDDMTYRSAIIDRKERVFELYKKLYKSFMDDGFENFEQQVRFHKVQKAVKDTQQLVDEKDLII